MTHQTTTPVSSSPTSTKRPSPPFAGYVISPASRRAKPALMRRAAIVAVAAAPLALAVFYTPGCEPLGYLANTVSGVNDVPASYKDLANHTCGILVWADQGLRIDQPNLEIDCAQNLQGKLEIASKAGAKEVDKIKFVDADRLARFQEDHPELDGAVVTDYAGRLPLQRLIYVEIEDFQLKPVESVELYRGEVKATIKVVQIDGGNAKVVYEEDGVTSTFPAHVTAEGAPLPDGELDKFYAGTIDAFTTEVSKRFFTHDSED